MLRPLRAGALKPDLADPVFVALDLLYTPPRQWLPDAASGPEPVALGDEFREAVGS